MNTSIKETQSAVAPTARAELSLSDTMSVARSLKEAVEAFASTKGFQMLTKIVENVPELEKKIEAKDTLLRNETDKVENAQSTLLAAFTGEYDKHKIEKNDLERQAQQWQDAANKKDQEITELNEKHESVIREHQKINEQLKESGKKLKIAFEKNQTTLKERDQELKLLQDKLKESQNKCKDLENRLSTSQAEAAKLLHSKDSLLDEYNTLHDETERLREVENLSVEMHVADNVRVKEDLIAWWSRLGALVREALEKPLPDYILEEDWSTLKHNAVFKHRIPLPQTNTPIAREMRIAVVLGALARLVNELILQPAYSFQEMDSLRVILNRQASEDTTKESFLRGIILSMFPKTQKKYVRNVKQYVLDDLEKDSGLRDILGGDDLTAFLSKLGDLLDQVQRIWHFVQRSTIRLEHDFKYRHDGSAQWKKYEFRFTDGDNKGDNKGNSKRPEKHPKGRPASNAVNGYSNDDVWVILPPIYLMDGEPQAIYPGTVLYGSQLDEVEQELAPSGAVKGPVEPETMSRSRANPNRRQSVIETSSANPFSAPKGTWRD